MAGVKLTLFLAVIAAIVVFVLWKNFYLVKELWGFMKVRKKWWLLPLIILILLAATIIIFAVSSPVSPFIYAFI